MRGGAAERPRGDALTTLKCVRTTVTLSDDIFREARIAAARTGKTFSQVVKEALRHQLDRSTAATAGRPRPFLPVSSVATGLLPSVHLEPKHELWDLLEGEGNARRP